MGQLLVGEGRKTEKWGKEGKPQIQYIMKNYHIL